MFSKYHYSENITTKRTRCFFIILRFWLCLFISLYEILETFEKYMCEEVIFVFYDEIIGEEKSISVEIERVI